MPDPISAWAMVVAIFVGIPGSFVVVGVLLMRRGWPLIGALCILAGFILVWVGYQFMFNVKIR